MENIFNTVYKRVKQDCSDFNWEKISNRFNAFDQRNLNYNSFCITTILVESAVYRMVLSHSLQGLQRYYLLQSEVSILDIISPYSSESGYFPSSFRLNSHRQSTNTK